MPEANIISINDFDEQNTIDTKRVNKNQNTDLQLCVGIFCFCIVK